MPAEVADQCEVAVGAELAWRSAASGGRLRVRPSRLPAARSCNARRRSSASGVRSGARGPTGKPSSAGRRSTCRSGRSGSLRRPEAGTACCSTRARHRRYAGRRTDGSPSVPARHACNVGLHAGNELELRLAEVGGDVRMRECRAKLRRMRRRSRACHRAARAGSLSRCRAPDASAYRAKARPVDIPHAPSAVLPGISLVDNCAPRRRCGGAPPSTRRRQRHRPHYAFRGAVCGRNASSAFVAGFHEPRPHSDQGIDLSWSPSLPGLATPALVTAVSNITT